MCVLHGCIVGVCDKNGVPIKKSWQIITNCTQLRDALEFMKCSGDHQHAPCAGSETVKTGKYTAEMAKLILDAFYGAQGTHVPAMACVKASYAEPSHNDNNTADNDDNKADKQRPARAES